MTTYAAIDGVATNVTTETKTIQTGRTRVYGVHVSGPNQAGVLELSDGSTSKVKLNSLNNNFKCPKFVLELFNLEWNMG